MHLRDVIGTQGDVVNMHLWLGRTTLDVIGEGKCWGAIRRRMLLNKLSSAAFGYKFNSLDNERNKLSIILNNLL